MEIAVQALAWGTPALVLIYAATMLGRAKWVALLMILGTVIYAPWYEYHRPAYDVATLSNNPTEIKREDVERIINGERVITNVDVRYIKTTDPMEYQNRDAKLWPLWFKSDSGRMGNRAENLAGQEVGIMFYGMRWSWFDMFPNAVAINPSGGSWVLFAGHFIFWLLPFGIIGLGGTKPANRFGKKAAA